VRIWEGGTLPPPRSFPLARLALRMTVLWARDIATGTKTQLGAPLNPGASRGD